ncbi:GH22276 [Drosophila grimshawi]|uniref:GH22276 n=1 Tax=Drosophila grimshawi TaxID=7222 RepID=B4JZ31_DROGR|nr:GH22276 [Drosophila grimshawi]
MDDVNPEWLCWQYPELPLTPEADTTAVWFAGPRPRIDSWESTEPIEPDETENSEGETEGPGTLGDEEPILISSEDEDTGEERRSSPAIGNPDDEDTMPFPQATPKPDVIVLSDEEEDEEWHKEEKYRGRANAHKSRYQP